MNFESARSSELPFLCPCCLVAANSKELATLKEAVVELVAEVSKLKSLCSSIVDNNDTSSTLQPSAGSTSTSASYATGVTIRWTGLVDWTNLCETKQETAPIIT